MCKLGVISCFTKTGCCWNFFCSIWMVWFVCSKLHNWLHSDFQAFFLVSWYYGVYQDWPLLFDFLFLWLRNVISSGWGGIYLMTCSCSWPAGCRGSCEESWSSSEASCRYRFRSGADEWPWAVPTRGLSVRQQHLLRLVAGRGSRNFPLDCPHFTGVVSWFYCRVVLFLDMVSVCNLRLACCLCVLACVGCVLCRLGSLTFFFSSSQYNDAQLSCVFR